MGERTVRTHVVAGRAAAITMLATVAKATVAKAKVVLASPAAAVKQGRQRGPTVQERRREEEEAAAAKEATSARTVIKKAAKARSPVLEVVMANGALPMALPNGVGIQGRGGRR